MITFRITYLTGAVRSADVTTGNDKSAPEWPPHPSRLFSAFVSAWGAAGAPEAGRQALEWLERQGPPALFAGEFRGRDSVVSYVPANDTPTLGQARRRNERRFPVAIPDADSAYVIWPDAELSAEQRRALEQLAALVPALGHSSSLVDVRLCDEAPAPSLVPADVGEIRLRVPTPGRLATLEALFNERRRPDAGRWHAYAPPGERPKVVAAGAFGDMVVYRLEVAGPRIPLAGSLQVCAAMRGAVLAHADQPVPEAISGHEPGSTAERPLPSQRPHLAFVPLADVGHRHARGHVMGVAAVLPRQVEPPERLACLRALGRVQELRIGRLGRFPVERLTVDVDRQALVADTWMSRSRVWATVTPVVLDRFPTEPFGREAERIVADSCVRAGYPAPQVVELGRVSWVLGVPNADDFPARPDQNGRPRRYHVHACLFFGEPIVGPMLIGAGRYWGYGFCRPLEA
jgi:CRISPR-associated protein Csb2